MEAPALRRWPCRIGTAFDTILHTARQSELVNVKDLS